MGNASVGGALVADVAPSNVTTYAETRDRTGDLQIFSLTLSQLSYRGSWRCGNRETHEGDAQLRCIFRIWLGA